MQCATTLNGLAVECSECYQPVGLAGPHTTCWSRQYVCGQCSRRRYCSVCEHWSEEHVCEHCWDTVCVTCHPPRQCQFCEHSICSDHCHDCWREAELRAVEDSQRERSSPATDVTEDDLDETWDWEEEESGVL
jgi:hypothetical protein